uniref:phosphatidyl-N-methylethanolamine N-methyltransferase n=1 Tax=Cairina moschata TaxID=8855 RepID=A0A8C3D0G1_CAIMO
MPFAKPHASPICLTPKGREAPTHPHSPPHFSRTSRGSRSPLSPSPTTLSPPRDPRGPNPTSPPPRGAAGGAVLLHPPPISVLPPPFFFFFFLLHRGEVQRASSSGHPPSEAGHKPGTPRDEGTELGGCSPKAFFFFWGGGDTQRARPRSLPASSPPPSPRRPLGPVVLLVADYTSQHRHRVLVVLVGKEKKGEKSRAPSAPTPPPTPSSPGHGPAGRPRGRAGPRGWAAGNGVAVVAEGLLQRAGRPGLRAGGCYSHGAALRLRGHDRFRLHCSHPLHRLQPILLERGDYFGILMEAKVTSFPFSVLDNPMYWGSTAVYLGWSLMHASPAGLLLTAVVAISYTIAVLYEGVLDTSAQRAFALPTLSDLPTFPTEMYPTN